MGTVREMRRMRRASRTDWLVVAFWVMAAALSLGLAWGLTAAAAGAEVPPAVDPNEGLTVWAILGVNPEWGKFQEARVGWQFEGQGWLAGIEVFGSLLHQDGPEAATQEWAGRAGLIAHALDAQMVASFLGNNVTLPDGNLYGGIFAQYAHDRDKEWSGGLLAGGLVDWPGSWQTVVEYQQTTFNSDHAAYAVVAGLRKRFKPPTHQ